MDLVSSLPSAIHRILGSSGYSFVVQDVEDLSERSARTEMRETIRDILQRYWCGV